MHVWLYHQTDAIHEFGSGVAGAPQPRMDVHGTMDIELQSGKVRSQRRQGTPQG